MFGLFRRRLPAGIKELQRTTIRPGDKIVVTVDQVASVEQTLVLWRHVAQWAGLTPQDVYVIHDGMKIEVISPEEARKLDGAQGISNQSG